LKPSKNKKFFGDIFGSIRTYRKKSRKNHASTGSEEFCDTNDPGSRINWGDVIFG